MVLTKFTCKTCKNLGTASKFRIFDNLALVWPYRCWIKEILLHLCIVLGRTQGYNSHWSLQKYIYFNITTDWLEMGMQTQWKIIFLSYFLFCVGNLTSMPLHPSLPCQSFSCCSILFYVFPRVLFSPNLLSCALFLRTPLYFHVWNRLWKLTSSHSYSIFISRQIRNHHFTVEKMHYNCMNTWQTSLIHWPLWWIFNQGHSDYKEFTK